MELTDLYFGLKEASLVKISEVIGELGRCKTCSLKLGLRLACRQSFSPSSGTIDSADIRMDGEGRVLL
jgi:hypothetical protein